MKMNKYLRYWSIILLFIGLLFFCDNGQLVHAQDNNSVISNDEINDDLSSKYAKGVYFAGEILNVDGLCGGYNLQWAWSSGFYAGVSAAKEVLG